jgi:hypothetical protein
MSEKRVKRERRMLGANGSGGPTWASWRFHNGAQLRFMTEDAREPPDPLVGSRSSVTADPLDLEEIFFAANRCGKTFANAGLALDDDGEVVVVDGRRLIGFGRDGEL